MPVGVDCYFDNVGGASPIRKKKFLLSITSSQFDIHVVLTPCFLLFKRDLPNINGGNTSRDDIVLDRVLLHVVDERMPVN